MSGTVDLDVLKDIPGYKAILKSVIKTQIQMLVEQLAEHTEEESIILTASVNDGTLSHLGSGTGKGFLEGRDEIKSQFLGYCLKSHHRKKTQEPVNKPAPYPRTSVPQPSPRSSISHPVPAKRPRIHPVSMTRVNPGPGDGLSPGVSTGELLPRSINSPSQNYLAPGVRNVQEGVQIGIPKIEPPNDQSDNTFNGNSLTIPMTSTPIGLPSSLQLSHTQTSVSAEDSKAPGVQSASGDNDSNSGSVSNIKVEPITEGEMELEITGVEMGDNSGGAWGQNLTAEQMGYQSSGGDDSLGQAGDQSGYSQLYYVLPRGAAYPTSDTNSPQPAAVASVSTTTSVTSGTTKSVATVSSISTAHITSGVSSSNATPSAAVSSVEARPTTQQHTIFPSNDSATIDLTEDDDDDTSPYTGMSEMSSIPTVVYPTSKPIRRHAIASSSHAPFDMASMIQGQYDQMAHDVNPVDSTATVEVEIDVDTSTAIVGGIDTLEELDYDPELSLEALGVQLDPTAIASTSTSTAPDPTEDITSHQPQFHQKGRGRVLHSGKTNIPVTWNRFYYGRQRDKIVLKKYLCTICGRRCMKNCDLQRHLRIHTGETPYSCPICRRKFAQKHNMVNHRRRRNCKPPVKKEPFSHSTL